MDLPLVVAPYCLLIVASSLFGGWLPSLIHLTHDRMQTLLSLVGGLMLGIGLFHMLPHALHELGPDQTDRAMWWTMVGLLTMFFLIRAFHFHQHGPAAPIDEHGHACGHDHDHDHDDHAGDHRPGAHSHRLSWTGVAVGLALHTFIDGMALGASIEAERTHEVAWGLYGLGTFLAIVLHKPLDAVSITSLMAAGGWSPRARMFVNIGFAMMCPLGAITFLAGVDHIAAEQSTVVGCALAFSAGVFLCISLGDLLPEMEFHSHSRVRLSVALLLGVIGAYAIGFLEPAHLHQHDEPARSAAPAGHHDHAH